MSSRRYDKQELFVEKEKLSLTKIYSLALKAQ